jgi:hypothetical protein
MVNRRAVSYKERQISKGDRAHDQKHRLDCKGDRDVAQKQHLRRVR